MRFQLLKLRKLFSTKAERKFAERLKSEYIKFRTKVKVNGREVDFIVKNYSIMINGHKQDWTINKMLVEAGYIPIHIPNNIVDEVNIFYLKS